METIWMIISLILYLVSCIFFYTIFGFLGAKSFGGPFTVKCLLLTLFWPITMWFIK